MLCCCFQTDVLKTNLMKADKEIEQLDKLMEQVKKVLKNSQFEIVMNT